MGKYYTHDDGTPSPVPTSKEDGKRFKQSMYDSGDVCPNCKTETTINGKPYTSSTARKYTYNDECPGCARLIAIEFYNYAVGASEFIDVAGPNLRLIITGDITPFGDELYGRFVQSKLLFETELVPITGINARERNLKMWVRPEPCPKAGHLGIRTLKGECYFCTLDRDTPSPRQQAITIGDKWYMPDTECLRCHTTALKRVDNGQCKGCMVHTPITTDDARETPDSVMMRESPGMMITRAAARTLGLKVYRTGKPCPRGHEGFRYVSTSGCIKCLRG